MKKILKRAIAFVSAAAVLISACGNMVQAAPKKIEKQIYHVTVKNTLYGTLILERPEGNYHETEEVKVRAVPEAGYDLKEIRADVQEVTKGELEVPIQTVEQGFLFTMPSGNVTISAYFELKEKQKETNLEVPVEPETELKVTPKATESKETQPDTEAASEGNVESDIGIIAETEAAQETEQVNFTKTFKVDTPGGVLMLRDTKGTLLGELREGQEKTFHYVEGSGAPEEICIEAMAEEGYEVDSYVTKWFAQGSESETPDSLYHIGEPTYKRGHYLSTAEFDETFEVSFEKVTEKTELDEQAKKESLKQSLKTAARAEGDAGNPQTGDRFTGRAVVFYDGHPNAAYNGTGYIECQDGAFAGEAITLSTCASGHDFAAPLTGQTGTYTITVTSVDTAGGRVVCSVLWVNDSNSSGYQNLSGSYTYHYNPDGSLSITKGMADSLDALIYPYQFQKKLDLSATFGVFRDAQFTDKVATVKTNSDGIQLKEELQLLPGTYYVKETKAPKGFALNETVKKVQIGSGASKSLTIKDRIFRAKVNGVKIDANTGSTTPTPGLSLAGAKYTVYGDEEGTQKITVGTTDEKGKIVFEKVYFAYGTYYIKETKAPEGYRLDPKIYKIVINEDLGFYPDSNYRFNDVSFVSRDEPETGKAKVKKVSANPEMTNGNSCYSVAGAEFKLTNDATGVEVKELLVTDGKGETQEIELPVGSYTIQETRAPKGYKLNQEKYKIVVEHGKITTKTIADEPLNDPVGILLKKIDLDTGKEVAMGAGTFENAEYTFQFYDEQYTDESQLVGIEPLRTWVLATNEKGLIRLEDAKKISGDDFFVDNNGIRVVPLGTVVVRETKAPNGYEPDPTVHIQNIVGDDLNGVLLKSYQTPTSPEPVIRGGVQIVKYDIELDENVPQGDAALQKATFDIYNRNAAPVLVSDKLYQKDEVVHTFQTDASGTAKTAKDLLPFGAYEIIEREAPNGYLNAGKINQTFKIRENGKIVELTGEEAIKNHPIRGDLKGIKVSDGDLSRMAGIPFKITSITTEESHVIVTDENGMFSTASDFAPHSQNTNRGETAEDGVWFGKIEALDDSKGALLYDTYRFEEVPCKANEDKVLLKPFKVVINKNMTVIDLGTITNDYKPKPEIGTRAKDKETGSNTGFVSEATTIIDTVDYINLTPGQEYTLKGMLMDKESKKPLLVGGKEVRAEKTFAPGKSSGEVELSFTFDSSSFAGKETVVFESLYIKDKEVAAHKDFEDKGQTVAFKLPEIKTKAADEKSGTNEGQTAEKTTITDTVRYSSLISGKTYTIKGVLMDKESGKPLLAGGKEIRTEKIFTPEKDSGTVELSFTFDSTALDGKEVVVFERLYYNDREIAVHADLKDQNQTVRYQGKRDLEVAKLADKTTGAAFNPKTGKYDGTKTSGVYALGSEVSWKIIVTNTGSAQLKQIVVEDILSQALAASLESVKFDCTDGAVLKTTSGKEVRVQVEGDLKVILNQLEAKDSLELTVKGKIKGKVPVTGTELENKVTAVSEDLKSEDKDAIKILDTPDKGTPTPSNPQNPGQVPSSPKTGDETPIALYGMLFLTALAAIGMIWKRGKRKKAIR